MQTRTTLLTMGLMISILIGNMAYSPEKKQAATIDGFPQAPRHARGMGSVLSHYHGKLPARRPSRRIHFTVVFGKPQPSTLTSCAAKCAVSKLERTI